MFIFNILLIRCIQSNDQNIHHTNEVSRHSKKKSLTYTVLILTTLFILLTLMDNILNTFFLAVILIQGYGYDLLFFADCLAFTYHGLHFLILLITNKKFSSEFKLMINFKKLIELEFSMTRHHCGEL